MNEKIKKTLNDVLNAQIECIQNEVNLGNHSNKEPKSIAQLTEQFTRKFIFDFINDNSINKSEVKKIIKNRFIDNKQLLRNYGLIK